MRLCDVLLIDDVALACFMHTGSISNSAAAERLAAPSPAVHLHAQKMFWLRPKARVVYFGRLQMILNMITVTFAVHMSVPADLSCCDWCATSPILTVLIRLGL